MGLYIESPYPFSQSSVHVMNIQVFETREKMGRHAAETGIGLIQQALAERARAYIILATGASQFDLLHELVQTRDVDWSRVTVFHLDEYIGLPDGHPASFVRYLRERFTEKLTTEPAAFHYIFPGDHPAGECRRLNGLIRENRIDVAFIGIGENGHLAFNDPPADFETEEPYIIVKLDEHCRKQQLGEGWFDRIESVPDRAVSMSVRQIMKSRNIICTVPDTRKADAVKLAVEGPVTSFVPSSMLQKHPACFLFLDRPAAGKLTHHAG